MSFLKYFVPWRHLGSSCATVFGFDVFGPGWPKWHPIWRVYRIGSRVDRARSWLRYRYSKKHRYHLVDTGLKPGYYDEDTRMLHACMALLCQYVEWHGGPEALDEFNNQLRDHPDPHAPEGIHDHQINQQSEAAAIYRWWKIERPANQQAEADMLHRLYGNREMVTRPVEINGQTMHEYVGMELTGEDLRQSGDSHETLHVLREQNHADDQAMLHRLIDIRPGLWT